MFRYLSFIIVKYNEIKEFKEINFELLLLCIYPIPSQGTWAAFRHIFTSLQFTIIYLLFSLISLHSSSIVTFSFFMTELSNDNCGPGLVERLSLNSKRFTMLLLSFLITLMMYFSCCFRTNVCSDSVFAIRSRSSFRWM